MKEEPRGTKNNPYPHYIYVNHYVNDSFDATDEWGRLYTDTSCSCKSFEEPCSGIVCQYKEYCLKGCLRTMKDIVDGKLGVNTALMYVKTGIPLIDGIAITILKKGPEKIIFRKQGQLVFKKETGIKGIIQSILKRDK